MRGSLNDTVRLDALLGSIPARAGQPSWRSRQPCPCRVHPRACGAAMAKFLTREPIPGPSPRVRGSRQVFSGHLLLQGSIPARAGQPLRRNGADCRGRGSIPARAGQPVQGLLRLIATGVHPRACGAAFGKRPWSDRVWGPSPRVRGSPKIAAPIVAIAGSIPARAGQPSRARCRWSCRRVHPRACGAAQGVQPSACFT